MEKSILRRQAFEKLNRYINNGSLDPKQFINLLNAKDHGDIIKTLQLLHTIDEKEEMQIWRHYIYHKAKGVINDNDRATVFDAEHLIFFREILKKKGVLTREYCLDKVFRTPHICDTRVEFLENLGLIERLELNNYRVIYILNIDFYTEAINDKE